MGLPRSSFFLLLFGLFLMPFGGIANSEKDSLRKVWKDPKKSDTSRLKAIYKLARTWSYRSPDSARKWCRKGIRSDLASSHPRWKAVLLNRLGVTYYYQSRYDSAHTAYKRAVRLFSERTDTSRKKIIKGLSSALNNLALIQEEQGSLRQALRNFQRSLDLRQRAKDSGAIASSYLNMGELYNDRNAYGKAYRCYEKAHAIFQELKDQQGIVKAYHNLGIVLQYAPDSLLKKENILPEERYLEVLQRFERVKRTVDGSQRPRTLLTALINLGSTYNDLTSSSKEALLRYAEERSLDERDPDGIKMILLDSAMKYGQRSSLLSEKFGSYHGKGSADLIIGRAHYLKGENEKAISVLEEAHEVFDSLSVIKRVRDVSKVLFKVYEEEGEHQKALKWHKTFLAAKDSVMDQEKEKKLALLEAKHRFREKRKLREARHQKELAIAEQEKRIQRIVSYASGAGLFMVLLFAYFLFDRLRTTRRQKRTIEEQKGAIEQKQEEIMASIDYASHIQAALLKDVDERREELPEHFVMFRPKDVVSGDFYWSSVEGDLTWFAVADCTGHGVPGAFLTMLGTTFLNEIIPHQKDPTPASVLDELDARFISELGEKADDGMDISILCIDRSKRTFQWAGANNPLYLVRKGGPEQIGIDPPSNVRSLEEAGNTLFELKPDKAPIGQSRKEEGFSLCQGTLGGNEHFYLFSDGYPDQFGGDKGKKFKYRPLKELILSLSEQPMNEQCKELEEQFDRWKGDLEQVDDVCLAGLRIP